MYCCVNTVIPLWRATTYNDFLTTSSRMVNHKTRERSRRKEATINFFMWMSHFSTTGVIKQTKLLSFFLKKQVNEFIRVKIAIILNCHNVK